MSSATKRLLCITPDLSQSGAPIALYGLIRILKQKKKFDIRIMTYGTGDLLHSYADLLGDNHITILNSLNPTPEFRHKLQNEYDLVLLNTSAVYPFSFFFQNTVIPVYWWIHEAPELIEDSFPSFPNPLLLSPNFHLFAPSAGAADCFRLHYSCNISVLPVPVFEPEYPLPEITLSIPDDRIIFLIPGAFSYIKGQDILLSAILSMPNDYRNKSFFIFCGYTLDKQIEYKNAIRNTASGMDNVLMLENLPHEEIYSLLNRCHCVIAPSRIDTVPLTIIEGMMFNKIVLASDRTGVSYYIQDCKNGFVFKDQEELLKRLLLIISDYDSLNMIAGSGNIVYREIFSSDSVSDLIDIIL